MNMAAFTTPLAYPKVQPKSVSVIREQPAREATLPWTREMQQVNIVAAPSSPDLAALHYTPTPAPPKRKNENIQINMAAASSCPHIWESDQDSPIDASSPFRLKRGDTIKRHSLGSDLFRLWPTPPTSTYIKPMRIYEEMQGQVIVAPLNVRAQRSTLRHEASRFSDWSPR